jgi:microcystin-dependent protein
MSISQYSALFSILGTTFGGNGVQTFNLPNLQGRAPVHFGQGVGLSPYVLGEATGTEKVTIATNQLPSHIHPATFTPSGTPTPPTVAVAAVIGSMPSPVGNIIAQPKQGAGSLDAFAPPTATTGNLGGVTGSAPAGGTVAVGPTGGGLPVSVIQPVLAVNFIIALVGIFPSRN